MVHRRPGDFASCGVARCLWYSYHGAARALPEDKIIPVQWGKSGGRWYEVARCTAGAPDGRHGPGMGPAWACPAR